MPNVLRMLRFEISRPALREMTSHRCNLLNGDVCCVLSYSRTTYANDVKFLNFDAGTMSILNIG